MAGLPVLSCATYMLWRQGTKKIWSHVIIRYLLNASSAIKMADIGSQVPVTPTAPEVDTSENVPLLQEEQRNVPPPAFNSGYNSQGILRKRLNYSHHRLSKPLSM